MLYICVIEMSVHLWENKTNQPKSTLVDILCNFTWEDKARKKLLEESLLAQMSWQDSKKRTTTAASVTSSADICAELFPLWLVVKFILQSCHFGIFY